MFSVAYILYLDWLSIIVYAGMYKYHTVYTWCIVAAMAIIDTKLIPVLIEKLQTEVDEIKVSVLTICQQYNTSLWHLPFTVLIKVQIFWHVAFSSDL